MIRIRELIGFDGQLIFNKDFVTEITFSLRHEKNFDEKNVCVQRGNSN